MRSRIVLITLVVAALGVAATASASPGDPRGVRPRIVQTYAYAAEFGTSVWIVGTADPNLGTGDCLLLDAGAGCPGTPPGALIGRAAYVGGIEIGAASATSTQVNINPMTSYLLFDAAEVVDMVSNTGRADLVLHNAQLFQNSGGEASSPVPINLNVSIVEPGNDHDGDGVADRTSTGFRLFSGTAPFTLGPGFSGVLQALSSGPFMGGSNSIGSALLPFNPVATLHPHTPPFGVAANRYVSNDSHLVIPMGGDYDNNGLPDLEQAARAAEAAGEAGSAFQFSTCIGGPNVSATWTSPLVLAVTGVAGSAEIDDRLQNGLAVDHLVHLMGDCDFASEIPPAARASSTFVELRPR
jgi:hypothetical protein